MAVTNLQAVAQRADDAERLALVAVEMILTLGARLGHGFDLRSYADAIQTKTDDADESVGRERLAKLLRQMAASLSEAGMQP